VELNLSKKGRERKSVRGEEKRMGRVTLKSEPGKEHRTKKPKHARSVHLGKRTRLENISCSMKMAKQKQRKGERERERERGRETPL
jgi:hypothetical protein